MRKRKRIALFSPRLLLTQPLINNCCFKQNYLKNIAFHFKFFKGSITHGSENDATTILPSIPHRKRITLFYTSSRCRQLPLIKGSGLQTTGRKKGASTQVRSLVARKDCLRRTFFISISCCALGSSVLSVWIFFNNLSETVTILMYYIGSPSI